MKKSFLLLLALVVLLMGTLPVLASAEEYSSEPTQTVSAEQQPTSNQPGTFSKVLWLIVVGPPVLIMLGVLIAVRVKRTQLWYGYLRDKFGVEDEEE